MVTLYIYKQVCLILTRLLMQNTGKLLAICLVLVFAIYHGLYLASNGVTPCKGLFKHGMVKGDGETW